MVYNQIQQYEILDQIMKAVCKGGDVAFMQLCSTTKKCKTKHIKRSVLPYQQGLLYSSRPCCSLTLSHKGKYYQSGKEISTIYTSKR